MLSVALLIAVALLLAIGVVFILLAHFGDRLKPY
jgi:hypothetical protein